MEPVAGCSIWRGKASHPGRSADRREHSSEICLLRSPCLSETEPSRIKIYEFSPLKMTDLAQTAKLPWVVNEWIVGHCRPTLCSSSVGHNFLKKIRSPLEPSMGMHTRNFIRITWHYYNVHCLNVHPAFVIAHSTAMLSLRVLLEKRM